MGRLAAIYRHPIKGLGEEALERAMLERGRPIPWDRVWAVAHGESAFDPAAPEWVKSRNFVIQSQNPALAQIRCVFDETTETIGLSHPDLGAIEVRPGKDVAALSDWIAPLTHRPGPYRIARLPGATLHDFPDTHISIGSLSSLRELEEMAGKPLEHIRFRMNLWLDALKPWEEFGWGEIAVGEARLKPMARVARCNATNASPATGARDLEIPKLLHGRFGHMDFGVYAQVVGAGGIAVGDRMEA